jgi:hypothetical protein
VAEGGGLLNRYTLQRRIEGSNPSGSANFKVRPYSTPHLLAVADRTIGAAQQCPTENPAAKLFCGRVRESVAFLQVAGASGG